MLQVIEHLPDEKKVLRSLFENTNSQGYLLLTGPDAASKTISILTKDHHTPGHYREGYWKRELVELIRACGYKPVLVKNISGNISGIIERIVHFLKFRMRSLHLFALFYPLLYAISHLDDYLKAKGRGYTSGLLLLAKKE